MQIYVGTNGQTDRDRKTKRKTERHTLIMLSTSAAAADCIEAMSSLYVDNWTCWQTTGRMDFR